NGGNMIKAFQTFYSSAHENGRQVPLEAFRDKYKIIDPGINVKFLDHDNFSYVLKEEGYQKMLEIIKNYLGYD
ncbi:hypothetical protein KKA13_01770, partial [Patescibacteria group bacterium]|nr:hypothetical protein [Patescibacteria group bacterium]